jgi:hypothetical protein
VFVVTWCVIISNFVIFLASCDLSGWAREGEPDYDKAGGCFADLLLRSSVSYHHEHFPLTANERCWLRVTDVGSAYGVVLLCVIASFRRDADDCY